MRSSNFTKKKRFLASMLISTFVLSFGIMMTGTAFAEDTAKEKETVDTEVPLCDEASGVRCEAEQETVNDDKALAKAKMPGETWITDSDNPDDWTAADAIFTANNIWMMIATFLVFIMHLGFATLEIGLTRSKNTVNILFKNTMIVAIGLLTYAIIGFNFMYPDFANEDNTIISGILGFAGFGIGVDLNNAKEVTANLTSNYNVGYTKYTDFLFQGMFAATAATIISGAVAERIKVWPFLISTTVYVALVYPITGSWKWGGGWLDEAGFYDFAGSTLVHSVGGWAALAAVLLLGPRLGKYLPGGGVRPVMGHNMPMAAIGVFLLWLGWFGFNGGSVLSANPGTVSLVLVTTSMAAAAGIIFAAVTASIVGGKPDLSMALNGALAGLVGITAGADQVSWTSALAIGAISGIIVVISVLLIDKAKIDDPVGAISVHLVCGIFGTLAVAWFNWSKNDKGEYVYTTMAQLKGILSIGAFSFATAFIIFMVVKLIVGLRVSEEDELKGLDISEHGMEAYSGFQIFTNE